MPELPEVERAARILRTAITGAVVDRVQLLHPALRRRVSPKSLRALRGATVSAVERRGKHQLIHLTDPDSTIIERRQCAAGQEVNI